MTTIEEPFTALPGVDAGIELVPLFRGVWKLSPYLLVPDGPAGSRVIIELIGGRLEGRGIRARASADWFVVGPGGIGTADWRGTVETDDGAIVYIHGDGRCDLSGGFGAGAVLIGGCHFETGDDRYRWLNRIHAVYRGTVVGDGLAGEGTYHDEYFEVR